MVLQNMYMIRAYSEIFSPWSVTLLYPLFSLDNFFVDYNFGNIDVRWCPNEIFVRSAVQEKEFSIMKCMKIGTVTYFSSCEASFFL